MRTTLFSIAASLSAALLAAEVPDGARAASDATAVLAVPRLERAPVLEDFLEMQPRGADAQRLLRVSGAFLQRHPADGRPASERTEVYLGYDERQLYAVFVAFDSRPGELRAHLGRRELLEGDDKVELSLDTFRDQRRAYLFACNPLGVQWDALWSESNGIDASFDTVWHSEGRRTAEGYVVLMAIPFQSLRFSPGEQQAWGVLFGRELPRHDELAYWPRYSREVQGRLNQAGTLTGLEDVSPGRNLQAIPYAAGRRFRIQDPGAGVPAQRAGEAELGLDAKLVLKDAFALDLALNPDFSQVESDEPQVTVNQRFELFYEEKRPFFLENAGYFRTPVNLLFTRRIGDPRLGARLTGKASGFTLGALLADDEAPGQAAGPSHPGHGQRAGFRALRVSRDVFTQSQLGLIYVERAFAGLDNRVAGLDGRIRWDSHWTSPFQAVFSSTGKAGDMRSGRAYDLSLNRAGRHFETHMHYMDVDPQFRALAGFVRRVDIREYHQNLSYAFRPEGRRVLAVTPSVFLSRVHDQAGTRLDRAFDPALTIELRGQTQLDLAWRTGRQRLRPQEVPGLAAPVDAALHEREVTLSSRVGRWLKWNASGVWGRDFNLAPPAGGAAHVADFTRATFGLTWQPALRVRLDATALLTRLRARPGGGRIFDDRIWRAKAAVQITRRLSLRAIAQYETLQAEPERTALRSSRRLNLDALATYQVNPWTALYVGVNDDARDLEQDRPQTLRPGLVSAARQVFFKLSYLLRR